MGLNAKQSRFVEEYLIDINATQAAIRAGYSKRSADKIASQLLGKTRVAEAIGAAMNARSERVGMDQDDVLLELQALGQSSVANYKIDDYGELQLSDNAPKLAMRAVASVKKRIRTDENGNVIGTETEFRLWDKPASLKMAGHHLGTFVERHAHEHSGKGGKPIEVVAKVIILPAKDE